MKEFVGKVLLWAIVLFSLACSHYFLAKFYGDYNYQIGVAVGRYEVMEEIKSESAHKL